MIEGAFIGIGITVVAYFLGFTHCLVLRWMEDQREEWRDEARTRLKRMEEIQ